MDFNDNLRNLISGADTGITPGEMLRITRESMNVSQNDFAEFAMVLPEYLDDIEHNRVPFPTMFLICIFSFGISAWYQHVSNDE